MTWNILAICLKFFWNSILYFKTTLALPCLCHGFSLSPFCFFSFGLPAFSVKTLLLAAGYATKGEKHELGKLLVASSCCCSCGCYFCRYYQQNFWIKNKPWFVTRTRFFCFILGEKMTRFRVHFNFSSYYRSCCYSCLN